MVKIYKMKAGKAHGFNRGRCQRHKVCQETNDNDYTDEFYTEAEVVRHEIASARN